MTAARCNFRTISGGRRFSPSSSLTSSCSVAWLYLIEVVVGWAVKRSGRRPNTGLDLQRWCCRHLDSYAQAAMQMIWNLRIGCFEKSELLLNWCWSFNKFALKACVQLSLRKHECVRCYAAC